MKRRRKNHDLPSDSLMLWARLALNTGEMMMASAQVITYRTGRMATAGGPPTILDQREFTLMGQEKIEAVTESAQAMASRMLSLNQEIGAMALMQMVAGTTGIMSIAASRTVTQSSRLQMELVRDAMYSSADVASQLADSVARLAQQGLKPIHSRAMANARRLAKLKK
jgi:hypothetical protein